MLQRRLATLAACGGLLGLSLLAAPAAGAAGAPESIRVGFVASLSGPLAPGAMTTTVPNYRLWAHDVNEDGGIYLSKYDEKVPVELIEVDDRSQIEDAVRQVERLIINDKVDFVLPPWGTGANLAVAPVLAKHGYPHLAVTAINERIPDLSKRWKNTSWFLGMPSEGSEALVQLLADLRDQGRIGNRVAVMNVAHQFGVELLKGAKPALEEAGFEIVYETSYPPDVKDLTPQVKAAKQAKPDAFLAFSYPGDTLMLTELSILNEFRPKFFFVSVGTAFPVFKKKFGEKAEGVFGIGGFDPSIPKAQAYFARHVEVTGQEPDRWASYNTYASLEVLQQAVERVGEIDHRKIIEEIDGGTFDTVLGEITMDGQRLTKLWWVGQWQDGEFVGVAPQSMPGAQAPEFDKTSW